MMVKQDINTAVTINRLASQYAWSQTQFEDSLSHHDIQMLCLGDIPIGFSIYQHVADESCLLNLAIHPQYQRKGHANYLLRQGLQTCEQQGAVQCYLEVRESNLSAIALYQQLDFIKAGVRKNYYPAEQGRENAVVMTVSFDQIDGENV
jgi:ribosomal-protein-alanine N-acetyltransferase